MIDRPAKDPKRLAMEIHKSWKRSKYHVKYCWYSDTAAVVAAL